MRIKASEVPTGACFRSRAGKTVKRLADGRCATVAKNGRLRKGSCPTKGTVELAPCTVALLGAGLPSSPGRLVEVGGPAPRRRRKA